MSPPVRVRPHPACARDRCAFDLYSKDDVIEDGDEVELGRQLVVVLGEVQGVQYIALRIGDLREGLMDSHFGRADDGLIENRRDKSHRSPPRLLCPCLRPVLSADSDTVWASWNP